MGRVLGILRLRLQFRLSGFIELKGLKGLGGLRVLGCLLEACVVGSLRAECVGLRGLLVLS